LKSKCFGNPFLVLGRAMAGGPMERPALDAQLLPNAMDCPEA